jgi:hypothetical protein
MKTKMVGLSLMVFLLAGCAMSIPWPSLRGPERPKTIYNWEERQVSNPVVLTEKSGKQYVAYQTDKQLIAHLDSTPRKVGLFERIGSFIAGLGFWIILALIIAFVIAPAGTIVFLFGQFKKYKTALVETVTAIKQSKATENPAVKQALVDNHSPETRTIVGQIKAAL